MHLPAELCKMQRKKRETDGFSKSTWMTPPGSHPTSGFGARHGLPKFFGIKNAASYKTMRQIGGPRGIRTLDLSDANRTLSQLSYRPILMTLIVYRVLGRLSSDFRERKRGTYKRPSCQKATALAAATLRESTPWDMGIFTV